MELFTIERYEGDSYAAENNAEKECKNLAQLLEQARGRKRLRECPSYKQDDESTIDENKKKSSPVLEMSPKVKRNTKTKNKRSKLERKVIKETSVENGNDSNEDNAVKMLERG